MFQGKPTFNRKHLQFLSSWCRAGHCKGQRALIGAGGDAGVAGGATGSDTTALGCDFERDLGCGSESGSANVTFFSETSRSCKHWNELESGMDEGGNEVGGQAGKRLDGSEGSGESKSGEISLAVSWTSSCGRLGDGSAKTITCLARKLGVLHSTAGSETTESRSAEADCFAGGSD